MAKGRAQTAMEGIAKASAKLNKEALKIKGKTLDGLLAAAIVILRRSRARVPRERSELFANSEARKTPENANAVEIVYHQAYAAYVHENVDMKLKGTPRPSGLGDYWGPAGEAKFLERPLMESRKEVLEILQAYAKINPRG